MKRHLLTAVFLLCMLSACEEQADIGAGGKTPVAFSVKETERQAPADTRASGELTTANITSMGVFAYYTGQSNWSTSNIPNFMWNEWVHRTDNASPWTYEPVKYWPNTTGDKISYFAYAPHTDDVPGLSINTGADAAGYPKLYYELPTEALAQKDLLVAVPLTDRTKGDGPLAFSMEHVMTRILVDVRCADAITVTFVALSTMQAGYGTLTWNSSGNPQWSFTSTMSAMHSFPTNVPANSADPTRLAEFFLYPVGNPSDELRITFNLNGSTETKAVNIPRTPAWEMGKTVAYTLNIETGSEITLSVKTWDTGSVSASVGEEVPTTGYPFMKNGIVYISASHAFALGDPTSGIWTDADTYCRNTYQAGLYKKGEWRLPTREELVEMYKIPELGYQSGAQWWWAYDCIRNGQNPSHGYAVGFNVNGNATQKAAPTYNNNYSYRCVRDVIGLQQPQIIDRTCYHSGGAFVVAKNSETGGRPASERCVSYTEDGVSGWRLPTKDELEIMSLYLGALNMGRTGVWYASSSWWIAYGYADHPSDYFPEIKSFSEAGFSSYVTSRCVRDKY